MFGLSSCCKALVNPVTGDNTCSCAGQESDNAGYVILSDCSKKDIDECDVNNGGCIDNAVCNNIDATANPTETHSCYCPPGLIGDGVNRCDIFVYETSMKFALANVAVSDVDTASLKTELKNAIALFSSVADENIVITVSSFTNGGLDGRRLLQSDGVEVEVVVIHDSSLDMETFTSSVDDNEVSTSLGNLYDTTSTVISGAQNVVLTADIVYGSVNTVLTGFTVEGIVYNTTAWEWLVTVRYVGDSPNTITSLYVSKTGLPPYSETVKDSFFLAKHPCMLSNSVCCLQDYVDNYHVGEFGSDVSTALGTCDAAVQAQDTTGMFDTSKNDDYLMNALQGQSKMRLFLAKFLFMLTVHLFWQVCNSPKLLALETTVFSFT